MTKYYRPHNTLTPNRTLAYRCPSCPKKFETLEELRAHKKKTGHKRRI